MKPDGRREQKTRGRGRATEFLIRTFRALFGLGLHKPTILPLPPLTLRVGVTGHLDIQDQVGLARRTRVVLQRLRSSIEANLREFEAALDVRAGSATVEMHLIASMAAGADQIVADVARACSFRLFAILPVSPGDFKADVCRNCGAPPGSSARDLVLLQDRKVASYLDLLTSSQEVFELSTSRSPTMGDYASAARAILTNCDILLAVVNRGVRDGVSLDAVKTALRHGTPVIWISPDDDAPSQIWQRDLEGSADLKTPFEDSVEGMVRSVVLGSYEAPSDTVHNSFDRAVAWFEDRYQRTFAIAYNQAEWTRSWPMPVSGSPTLLRGIGAVQRNFKNLAMWADLQAAIYSSLYRGAFVLNAWLGVMAAVLALTVLANKDWGTAAKVIEIAVLIAMWLVYSAATHGRWRDRWLGWRAVYQRTHHSAWRYLLGETSVRSGELEFGHGKVDGAPDLLWLATVRSAGIASSSAQPEYLDAIRKYILKGLVERQIDYFSSESVADYHLYERYERRVGLCVGMAIVGTLLYLLADAAGWQSAHNVLSRLATFAGAFFPICAAGLVAVAGFEEHGQMASRFAEMVRILKHIRRHLHGLRPAGELSPTSSRALDRDAVERLLDAAIDTAEEELTHWKIVLSVKQVEK